MPRRYCTGCRNKTSHFEGDICPACVKRAARRLVSNAREYVAGYMRDHPMFVPRKVLETMANDQRTYTEHGSRCRSTGALRHP